MKLLLVEDEPKLGKATKRGLELEGYSVELVTTAAEALHCAAVDAYDLIILDRMLPEGMDGIEVCGQLRARGWHGPILLLTALAETSDKIAGLKKGADDYLAKPFSFDELVARIQALLRRPAHIVGPKIETGPIEVDISLKKVTKGGEEVTLTKREYALVEYLAHNKGRTLSKEQIIDHVWDFDADVLPNTVEVFVKSIRHKIGDTNNDTIKTIRGFGYRMEDS